jgi:hypothetical protein
MIFIACCRSAAEPHITITSPRSTHALLSSFPNDDDEDENDDDDDDDDEVIVFFTATASSSATLVIFTTCLLFVATTPFLPARPRICRYLT